MKRHPGIRRAFFFFSGKRALPYAVAFFVFSVLLFGAAYSYLTPLGEGVKEGSTIPEGFGFLQGLYFSIVTISSLGYGDLRPVGYSRVLAGIEVVLGLSLIGIMLAALTSRLLSHLVSRLFVSDARKRLQEFSVSFDDLGKRFLRLSSDISWGYQATPGKKQRTFDTEAVSSKFHNATQDLLTNTTDVHNYIQDESGEGIYFDLVPVPALKNTLDSIYETFFRLNQGLISLPTHSRPEGISDILNKKNRERIMDSIKLLRDTSEIGRKNSRDTDIVNSFGRLDQICEAVSDSLLQIPVQQQPEQVVYTSTTPKP